MDSTACEHWQLSPFSSFTCVPLHCGAGLLASIFSSLFLDSLSRRFSFVNSLQRITSIFRDFGCAAHAVFSRLSSSSSLCRLRAASSSVTTCSSEYDGPPPPGCVFHPRCPIAEADCARIIPELKGTHGRQTACLLVDPDKATVGEPA